MGIRPRISCFRCKESASFEAGTKIAQLIIYVGLAPARDLSVMPMIKSIALDKCERHE